MSCSGSYNLDIYQGDYYSLGIIANDDNGNGLNISGYQTSGAIKLLYSSGEYLFFDFQIVNNPTGYLIISLQPSGTNYLPVGQQLYNVTIFPSGSNQGLNLLRGYVNVFPSVI